VKPLLIIWDVRARSAWQTVQEMCDVWPERWEVVAVGGEELFAERDTEVAVDVELCREYVGAVDAADDVLDWRRRWKGRAGRM